MGSINAQKVAHNISAKLRKGEKVVLAKAVKEAGYSHSVSRHPDIVTNTIAFKKAFAIEMADIISNIDRDIARFQQALASKDLESEETRVIVSALDTLIKNKQLLSGGATANVGVNIQISEHMAKKYKQDIGTDNGGSTGP